MNVEPLVGRTSEDAASAAVAQGGGARREVTLRSFVEGAKVAMRKRDVAVLSKEAKGEWAETLERLGSES